MTALAGNAEFEIATAITNACRRMAPLWPLKNFVAVNPFLGFTDRTFSETCAVLHRVAQADMLLSRVYYLEQIAKGLISDTDLQQALTHAPYPTASLGVEEFKKVAHQQLPPNSKDSAVVSTVAEILDSMAQGNRQTSRTSFMLDEISKWCAAYFDEGQATWGLPWRSLQPYAAWRMTARHDRNPEVMGIKGFRETISALPESPVETIATIVRKLGIPANALEDYLHRALFDIKGWASYARYRVWQSELEGKTDETLIELLAIRVAWGYALFKQRTDTAFKQAWANAMKRAALLEKPQTEVIPYALAIDLILHDAYERAHQRRFMGRLVRKCRKPLPTGNRKSVQAAFCIDVRSEVYRRCLETVSPDVETYGFAGFFGFPVDYIPIGGKTGRAQCPVLLKPSVTVHEHLQGGSPQEQEKVHEQHRMHRRIRKAWKAFKLLAVSSFTYVETLGLGFAGKIVSDTFRLTRPVPDPDHDGLDPALLQRIGPDITPGNINGQPVGFERDTRIAMAKATLTGMSLTENFARLVAFVGHGSTTVNNPHASGLDCGACGGHTGEANARIVVAVLNDPHVRTGLRNDGIVIPEDTWFLGCLHDTTTDDITIYDEVWIPPSHRADVENFKSWLKLASVKSRNERAPLLQVPQNSNLEHAIRSRSRDWSEVRPEWGLAGNTAFIAAPRERTYGLNLKGRCFLHTYDYRKDTNFHVLEQIMTAPMVVASWINLQYFGSSVNNVCFGSGNKVLHNVVGGLGVLEGNGGDLRAGLPWQSVHDGARFIHEPVRLLVCLEAPIAAIEAVIAKHHGVRDLVRNKWVHLFALTQGGESMSRYLDDGHWEEAA